MPSDVSVKLAEKLLVGLLSPTNIKDTIGNRNILAQELDDLGVGDAFAACKCVAEDVWPNKTAKKALRKAGMV